MNIKELNVSLLHLSVQYTYIATLLKMSASKVLAHSQLKDGKDYNTDT